MTLRPVLFSTDPRLVGELAAVETPLVAAVVCDWERQGKKQRQARAATTIGTDTQIGTDTEEDLRRVTRSSLVPVWCRINAVGDHTPKEVELALEGGADELLLPMVRTPEEVEHIIGIADGRAEVGILIETEAAVSAVEELASLPLSRGYVGLMDLALGRGADSIFTPFVDGTLERVRARFPHQLGVAGLTVPGRGRPIPARLLCGEMVRLGYDFSFMRRSFTEDAIDDPAGAVIRIANMIAELELRTGGEEERDSTAFRRLVVGR